MKVDISEIGGAYQVFVAEDNSSVYVRLLPNDAVGTDGYRARTYSPDIGRFLQQDPAGMVDGPNLYAYCGNEPVNRVDPSGTFWWRTGGPGSRKAGSFYGGWTGSEEQPGTRSGTKELTYAICMSFAYEAYSYKLQGLFGLSHALFISCLRCVYALFLSEKDDCGLGWKAHECISAARVRYHSDVIDCQRKSGEVMMTGVWII